MKKCKSRFLLSRIDEKDAYDNYKRIQKTYSENFNNMIDKEEISGILSVIKKYSLLKGKVIDIGAGTGQLTRQLLKLKKKFSIDALDTSFDLLGCIEKIDDKRIHRIIRASFYDTGLVDKNYDLIVSNFALNYSDDIERCFIELSRILKKQGYILFSSIVADKPSRNKLRPTKVNSILKTKFGEISVYGYQKTEEEIIDCLKRVGFKPIRLSKKSYFIKYSPKYFLPDPSFKRQGIRINTFVALAKK